MGSLREVLAANLRRSRRVLDLSQEELAYRAGLDRTYVGSLERCEYSATVDVLERLAEALGTEPSELLRPAQGPMPDPPARQGRRGRPIG